MERPSVKMYLLWGLITLVQIHGHRGCFEEERMGLLQFKEFVRTSGADADRLLPSWVDDTQSTSDCCGWERVTCNSTTGHVIELSLHNINQLSNYFQYYDIFYEMDLFEYSDDKIWLLNVSIFHAFKELRSLNLSLNEIGGCIENEGFESLSRWKRLETLDLGFNKLNMSIIQSLSAITSLKNLILNDNNLEGSFPAKELSALENLETLNLRSTRLNGSLTLQDSKSLSKLGKLKQLNLSQNSLNKEIIRYLAALPVLNSLDLSRNRMDGRLENADLADMKSLKVLNLQHNSLHGVLPVEGFAASGSLEILDLSLNIFESIIPPNIGRLTSLKALSLSQNRFNGSLPSEGLCKLEKLEEFDVSMNHLEGILPSCINNLTSLRLLDLSMNEFSGHISSSWIASLTSLQYIDLGHNKFEGVFSFSSLANHSQLQVVQFTCDDYKLQITEISGWIPLFQLQLLVLSNCLRKLSTEIPAFLFHQHNLRVADLSHNKLKGRFPGWLLENNTRLEYLSLRDNSFLGPVHLPPGLNLSISWMDVSANQFDGQLQENIGNLLPNIKNLDLSKNAFEGRLPSSIGNMSGMERLVVSFNNFSGVVPKELVADCSKLVVLKLSRNNFHGDLFLTQFNLTRVRLLDFSDNQFSGTLSKKLFKFALVFLDGGNNHLSGKIPSWICNKTNIGTLILCSNFFRGHFQCESGSTIEFLDLSHNLLSGSLPSWSGVDSLKHIHFQGNMFSGSIPKAFINALINGSGIVTLDIRENNLSGSIPIMLGAVSTLKVLLLNGNSFGGLIPTQLCQLIQVNIMDLSNNKFSGSIPRCFHYIAFGNSYYVYDDRSGLVLWNPNYMSGGLMVKSMENENYHSDENYELSLEAGEAQFVTKHKTSSYKGLPLRYMSGLDLSANNLTGPIPHELGMLASLHALNLSRNQLTGSIPNTFSNLTQLESMDLSHNNLSGEIPSALNGLNFLAVFTVAYNNLSGRIPDTKQFATFDERSYEQNPLLCGRPLKKSCDNVDDQPPHSATKPDGKWYKVDLAVFFPTFFVAYFMFFLGAVAFLYFNPYCYWQRRCFELTEDCMFRVTTLLSILYAGYQIVCIISYCWICA